jgi:XisI protein
MDTLSDDRTIIRRCLEDHANLRYANGDICNQTIFDEANARYLVVSQGWMGDKRVHGCLLHVEIIGGKVWVQRDGTEGGIANELVEAGIPRERIVLGFWDPDARKLGDFAAA